MTVLENLLVAQHNKLMLASGYHRPRPARLRRLPQGVGRIDRAGQATGWRRPTSIDRADDPAGDLPYGAQRRLEIARAMCTGPELLCLDEPAAGLNPRESLALNALLNDIKDDDRHLDPADRARHVGGHADFRPRRRAGIRPQDLRRRSDLGEERSARHRRLSRRRRRGGHRRAGGGRRRAGDRATRRRAGPRARAVGFGLDDGRAGLRHGRPQRRGRRDRQGFERRFEGRAVRPSPRRRPTRLPRRAAAAPTS